MLQRMKVRYREPYNARHSSVNRTLTIGKGPAVDRHPPPRIATTFRQCWKPSRPSLNGRRGRARSDHASGGINTVATVTVVTATPGRP